MRMLCEIVADAKDGVVPTHEECFWAMLALSGKLHFANRTAIAISEKIDGGEDRKILLSVKIHLRSEKNVREDHFNFLRKDPKEWLGDSGNPFTEESKKWMEMGKAIIEKATAQKL